MTIRWCRGISREQNRSKLFCKSVIKVWKESFTKQLASDKNPRRQYDGQGICLLPVKESGGAIRRGSPAPEVCNQKGGRMEGAPWNYNTKRDRTGVGVVTCLAQLFQWSRLSSQGDELYSEYFR